jgi:hypothetical protein
MNPTQLKIPVYLMNSPIAFENNGELKKKDVNFQRLVNQFFELYNYISSESCVYLIPNNSQAKLINLATASIGNVLFDKIDSDNINLILNNNNSILGEDFFRNLGYSIGIANNLNYEGELTLKYLKDNVYLGGYSDEEGYKWLKQIEDFHKIKIIKLCLIDENLPYLNNSVFPITKDYLLLCTDLYTKKEIKEIEEFVEIESVSLDDCYQGACNNLRLFNSLINSSNIFELKRSSKEYKREIKKNRFLEDIAADYGMELIQFNMSEYLKINFWLSDLILTLNNSSYLVDAF